ncbi:MAG: RagB/SusD family nutrient uptake outer membrane protein [Bacteroidales bacterium]
MKKYNKIISALIMILIITSFGCKEDFLDLTNPNELTPDQFWKTESDVDMAITSLYACIGMGEWSEQWDFNEHFNMCQEARSDMVRWSIWQPQQAISEYTYTPTQYMERNQWKWCYKMIFTANQIIENVAKMTDLDAAKKKIYDGEAKFARGHAYFLLLKNFGNVVLVTELAKTPDDFYKPQSPAADVWAQIEKDFTDAKANLPASWEAKWLGRATKGAATAYLGKAYLFQEKWAQAETEFRAVTTMGYSLVSDYESLFTGLNEHSSESIFEVNFSATEEAGRLESVAVAELYSEYNSVWVTDWGKELFLNDKAPDGGFSKRFYASVLWDDPGCSVWYWNDMNYRDFFTSVNQASEDRMFFKKYVVYRSSWPDVTKADNNYFILRYDDVLLMLAEALNEQGKTGEAIPYVNQVRERAGSVLLSSLSQSQLRQHIREVERPLEFVCEATRFDDLKRWYGFGKEGGLKALLMSHGRYSAENFRDNVSELWPIPQRELDANPKLEQNPGY